MKLPLMLLLPLALLAGGCPLFLLDDPESFEPDDCSSPRALDGVDAIELGALARVDGRDVFVPWADDELVDITVGIQGGSMLGVALRLRGSNVPACVDHRMVLRYAEAQERQLASTWYPVRTYSQPDGTRITGTMWMIFNGAVPRPGEVVELHVQMGSFAEQRRLQIIGPRPDRVRLVGALPLQAGSTYSLEIQFDRYILDPMVVTIASSDPEVFRPVEPSVQLDREPDFGVLVTRIEAVATGSATLSISAHGGTIETELRVQ
jgi:hypothetical protein